MRKLHSTKGFTPVALLIVVTVVGVIVVLGAVLFGRRSDDSSTTSSSGSSVQTSYLEIKEWGVKVPNKDVDSLGYSIDKNVATFRSTELDNISIDCITNRVDVARGKADELVPNGLDLEGLGNTFKTDYDSLKKQLKEIPDADLIAVKIGDYYYVTPDYSKARCAEEGDSVERESQAIRNIAKALNGMVAE